LGLRILSLTAIPLLHFFHGNHQSFEKSQKPATHGCFDSQTFQKTETGSSVVFKMFSQIT